MTGSAGSSVRVTSPDRVLWPAIGWTKRDMLAYLEAVADPLLAHLRNRPVTLRRFPEGVGGPGWFQTECRGAPSWIPTVEVRGARGRGQRYCRIEEPAALIWAANRGALEFHPLATPADRPGEPTSLVIDLDPRRPATIVECCRVALLARDRLAAAGLRPVVKTSGSRGLHVVAPLGPGGSFRAAKVYARQLARDLRLERPNLVIDTSDRAAGIGRVFVDWVANDLVRSIVAPYSLRALERPVVSTPLAWAEVDAAARDPDTAKLWFLPREVVDRLVRHGDLFAGALGPGLPPPDPGAEPGQMLSVNPPSGR